ncbi:MAG: class I SAM-dependent methyltransferase, partial [Acidimicrobiia bacterium]
MRELGKEELALFCEAAFHSFSNQTDETYFSDNKAVLERAYLRATTPQGGSGSSGDDANWEVTRRLHVEAIRRDGTYLDTGCANGLLMESMVKWAAGEGYKLDPYGVDISDKLVEVARERLPEWADHIYVGNVMHWQPPIRFDYVTTRLEYV